MKSKVTLENMSDLVHMHLTNDADDNNNNNTNNSDIHSNSNSGMCRTSYEVIIIGGCDDGSIRIWSLHNLTALDHPTTPTTNTTTAATAEHNTSAAAATATATVTTNTKGGGVQPPASQDITAEAEGCETEAVESSLYLHEIYRMNRAHNKACTSIACYNEHTVSGGDDGSVRMWRIVTP